MFFPCKYKENLYIKRTLIGLQFSFTGLHFPSVHFKVTFLRLHFPCVYFKGALLDDIFLLCISKEYLLYYIFLLGISREHLLDYISSSLSFRGTLIGLHFSPIVFQENMYFKWVFHENIKWITFFSFVLQKEMCQCITSNTLWRSCCHNVNNLLDGFVAMKAKVVFLMSRFWFRCYFWGHITLQLRRQDQSSE